MQDHQPIRILGLTMERVGNIQNQSNTKSAGLYAALHRRFTVVDVVRPAPGRVTYYGNKLLHFHPNRDLWRSHASLNPWMFKQRTAVAERQLHQRQGAYDIIVQLHTLLAPGTDMRGRTYVIHTDNSYILSEQFFSPWAPLRGQERNEWIKLERQAYQNAAFLFPRSEFLRRSMIEDYGCDPERVICVGGGANFPSVSLATKRYDQQVALFVGYDFQRKGGHVLLRAWELVHQRMPDAQLWLVGPKHLPATLPPQVHSYGVVADRQQVAQLYEQATLFVMPSLFEPWGHVFFEAMAYGLPCIGSDQGATPEIIQHGMTGLLVPPGEPEPLADALVELLDNPSQTETLGRQAYAYVAQNNTWDDVVARMSPYIQQAVDSSTSRVLAQ